MTAPAAWTPTEMMTIVASRALKQQRRVLRRHRRTVCRLQSGRLTHAPGITLIYESGTIATKPNVLPLSIGDGELCETALTTVSVPEMFRYWLQGGRIIGRLPRRRADRPLRQSQHHRRSAAPTPSPRCGCRAAAARPRSPRPAREVFITMAQGKRSFVDKLDFITSLGHGEGKGSRERLGVDDQGPDARDHRSVPAWSRTPRPGS